MARDYRVVAIRHNNNAVLVYINKKGRFNFKGGRVKMTKGESIQAKRWAVGKKRCKDAVRTKSKYPFVILDSDTNWPKARLNKKLNKLGKRRKRIIFINEGWRTHARQWELWNLYRAGKGNLAAYPGTSNHEYGNAADASFFSSGAAGYRVNIGDDSRCRNIMKKLNLCLPVAGESWHVEIGTTFRA